MKITATILSLTLFSCTHKKSPISVTDEVPVEIYSEFRNNLFLAEKLAEYDRLAWIASDSNKQFQNLLGAIGFQGYVVDKYTDSAIVSFGSDADSGSYMKYSQVTFDANGAHPKIFINGVPGNPREVAMYLALQKSMRNMSSVEMQQGKHNFYTLINEDTVQVYLIPGYLRGQFVFGGSFMYTFVNGNQIGKRSFHFGYQYVKERETPIDVSIKSELNRVPNECDIMKFLAYRDYVRKMEITTSEYVFRLTHKIDGGVGVDIKRKSQ